MLTLPHAMAGPETTHAIALPKATHAQSVHVYSAPNTASKVRVQLPPNTTLISRILNGQWHFVEVRSGPFQGTSGWVHQQFIVVNAEYNGPMLTQSLTDLLETLRTAHPNKLRVSTEQFAAAMCEHSDTTPSVRLLIGVHDMARVDQFYTDRARSLSRVSEDKSPETADEIKIAPELMPGETWIDGFFRLEELEDLLALDTVFSVENATMRHK